MSVKEIEAAITKLSSGERAELVRWLAQFQAEAWDGQIESDLDAGRLDAVLKQADAEWEAGKAEPL